MNKIKTSILFFLLLSAISTTPLTAGGRVQLGVDMLQKHKFSILNGARVALITNHTGLDGDGDRTVDVILGCKISKLICILTPEHGFGGTAGHGQEIGDAVDAKTGLPIYSLYGKNSRPTDEMLKDVDTIVFDIQDIGTRFYTYIATMGQAMEVASRKKLHFVVLDRPNPIRGDIMEGEVLDSDVKRLTGYFPLPVRHGLTIGEIALWFNKEQQLGVDLNVVKMKNWHRSLWFDQLNLVFTPPSPNIPTLTAALLYPGIGCFEATNVSVGRGTPTPFEIFGAPWVEEKALCAYLRQQNFPGVLFEPVRFTPSDDIYKGQSCGGIRVIVTHREKIRPFDIFLTAFSFLYNTAPTHFKPEWDEVRVVTGSNELKEMLESRAPLEDLISYFRSAANKFAEEIKPYFLYN